MAISDLLNRRVRALPEEDEEVYSDRSGSEEASDHAPSDSENASDDSLDEDDVGNDDMSDEASDGLEDDDDDDDDDHDNDSESHSEAPEDDVQATLGNISFGALAKAQASLGPKAKRASKTNKKTDEANAVSSPLDDIRARIQEAREQKRQGLSKSKDSEKPSRSSKHAPMVQSSKYAVSRKRTVVEPPSVPKSRDPRFDPTVTSAGGRGNPQGAKDAYAFLDEYRANELKELKAQYAKTKNPAQKEALKREIRSTQDRLRAMESRKREREILSEHKKKEKQLIREGKKSNPYYMKKSDLKKQVLLQKYESMNSKDRTKALERRRKKTAAKERKEMPMERRALAGDDAPRDHGGGFKRRRLA
ncbi:putative pre-rRNA processing protein [Aspergillus homomorphus CBS 101889]|uniref:rRNA biogenesis protein RRP36 n=1 Tax=Aspergillus homomorphus (strain CBS 101889) TaxID=1450537 RepID=A0A395HJH5_ASPHC|nr:putative pre-rRNA processing protein [Aspergillus homomorphus CBS 101889]RAL07078.1 putative pre-rRNA processing protein [Aspergillus homomorphus CBS 101889]